MNSRQYLINVVGIVAAFVNSSIGQATDTSLDAAWRAWQRGDVVEAEALAENLGTRPERSHLLFFCSMAQGRYEAALAHYRSIDAQYSRYGELDRPLIDCHLHLGHYDESVEIARMRNIGNVKALQMRAANPLQASLEKVTVVPFVEDDLTDYFPAFKAEINRKPVTIRVDTGGGFLVMGPHHAESLGIELTDVGSGFHGPRRVKSSFGIAKKFKLGDAVLDNVPVVTLATVKHFIFGTNVLQQFHSTLDYPNRRLILSPQGDAERRKEHMAMLPERRVSLPFYMWHDHHMFACGSVADDDHLNFFIDTGLVALRSDGRGGRVQAGFSSSRERYRDWGCTESEEIEGVFKSLQPIGLGPLKQEHPWMFASAGGEKHGNRTFGGVQIHGLLGHAFLKRYCWTIDFEDHKYVFSQESNMESVSPTSKPEKATSSKP